MLLLNVNNCNSWSFSVLYGCLVRPESSKWRDKYQGISGTTSHCGERSDAAIQWFWNMATSGMLHFVHNQYNFKFTELP